MQRSENNKQKSSTFEIMLRMWHASKLDVHNGYKKDFIAYWCKYRLAIVRCHGTHDNYSPVKYSAWRRHRSLRPAGPKHSPVLKIEVGDHRPLAGTNLYCSVAAQARVWTTCPRLLREFLGPRKYTLTTGCESNALNITPPDHTIQCCR